MGAPQCSRGAWFDVIYPLPCRCNYPMFFLSGSREDRECCEPFAGFYFHSDHDRARKIPETPICLDLQIKRHFRLHSNGPRVSTTSFFFLLMPNSSRLHTGRAYILYSICVHLRTCLVRRIDGLQSLVDPHPKQASPPISPFHLLGGLTSSGHWVRIRDSRESPRTHAELSKLCTGGLRLTCIWVLGTVEKRHLFGWVVCVPLGQKKNAAHLNGAYKVESTNAR